MIAGYLASGRDRIRAIVERLRVPSLAQLQGRLAIAAGARPMIASAVALAMTGLATWSLYRQFGSTSLDAVRRALLSQNPSHLLVTGLLTAVSFACLASYDLFAVRIVAPMRVPTWIALVAGSVSTSISNTLGFHALTGTVARLRIYRICGLATPEVIQIMSLSWIAMGLGFLAMLGMSLLLQSVRSHEAGMPLATGIAIMALLVAFISWLSRGQRRIAVPGFTQQLPTSRLASIQMGIGSIESAAAIGALYVLLPPDLAPSFGVFAVGCITAVALGVISHAPGGIGVFEAGITAMLAGQGRADLLAALLSYRLVYNLAPFLISVACLASLTRISGARASSKQDSA
jgi:uncharacterized membrane protein YbhN (UPF0104 family)